jgi:hypothetical protein
MGMRLQDVEEIYTLLVETKNTMELPKKWKNEINYIITKSLQWKWICTAWYK